MFVNQVLSLLICLDYSSCLDVLADTQIICQYIRSYSFPPQLPPCRAHCIYIFEIDFIYRLKPVNRIKQLRVFDSNTQTYTKIRCKRLPNI